MFAKILYYGLIGLAGIFPLRVYSQGTALLNISFGEGNSNPGYPLASGNSEFLFTTDSCPAYGKYTITNNLYRCAATRMGRSLDNTPQSNNGYMMLLNTAGDNSKMVFIDTIQADMCAGTTYRFSAYFLNAAVPSDCPLTQPLFPSFRLSVATLDGRVLQEISTGPLSYAYNMDRTPRFRLCAADFIMPAAETALVLSIRNEVSGGAVCTFPVAVDDISLASTGPELTISFSDAGPLETVRSVCFQQNATISFRGTTTGYYSDPRFQWQQSTDSGETWLDIPGAVSPDFTRRFSEPDTFLFRLSSAEGMNIQNLNCRVHSGNLRVEVNGIPDNISVVTNAPVCAGSELHFEASGGVRYLWNGPDGFYDNIARPHIYASSRINSGMYYVTIITAGGCSANDSVYALVKGVEADAGPDTIVCRGSTVTLSATAGSKYSWFPSAGLSSSVIRHPVAKPEGDVVYTVTVSDEEGCSDTASVRILLRNTEEVKSVISGNAYLCRPYDSLVLHNASAGYQLHCQWNFDNGNQSSAEQPPVQYITIPDMRNQYRVQLAVTDSSGCADTATYMVKVVNNCYIAVPGAFTPNGDGLNDELSPLNTYKVSQLLFRVYNRKGVLVFESRDRDTRWDGRYRGEPQDAGTYAWILSYLDELGKPVQYSGSSVLIR